jgi:hypothetical protein
MDAFQDHYNDLQGFYNSSVHLTDKLHWNASIRDMVDYYINKTAELLQVYTELNVTIEQIKAVYCAPKKKVVFRKSSYAPSTATENVTTTSIAVNYTAADIDSTVNTTPATTSDNSGDSTGTTQAGVISIFMQKLQAVATMNGLPTNYVQTRINEIKANKEKARLLSHNRRIKKRHV